MSGGYQSSQSSSNSRPQLTPQQLLQLYGQALPNIANIGGGAVSPINTALASSAAASNPVYTASGLQQLAGYAPGYTGAGAGITNLNDLLSSGILSSGGSALTSAALPLLAATNPSQTAANQQGANLVNSINLNGLSGGEQEAVERSLNQDLASTGNLGVGNAFNTVGNAMNFGQALQAKRAALTSALGAAQGVSATQNNIFNPITSSLANPGQSNFGLGTFNPTQANSTITSPLAYLSSIFGPVASNASSQTSRGQSSSSGINVGI